MSASVYVVGGGAVALQAHPRRLTLDVDATASDQAEFEEPEAMAAEEGLPPNWLTVPPSPGCRPVRGKRIERTTPVLDVHLESPTHLLAMKMVASRDRDVDDIKNLAAVLHLEHAGLKNFAWLAVRQDSGCLPRTPVTERLGDTPRLSSRA